MKDYICHTCNKPFSVSTKPANPAKPFCSRSCAAKHNNTVRTRTKLKGKHCCICNNECSRNNSLYCSIACKAQAQIQNKLPLCYKCKQPTTTGVTCNNCRINNYGKLDKLTLKELRDIKGTRGYHTTIRTKAAKAAKNLPRFCYNCGYSKHIEVCHIKAVKDFDSSTTLEEVNQVDNLVLLCPNCHWEFDHGLLKLKQGVLSS